MLDSENSVMCRASFAEMAQSLQIWQDAERKSPEDFTHFVLWAITARYKCSRKTREELKEGSKRGHEETHPSTLVNPERLLLNVSTKPGTSVYAG